MSNARRFAVAVAFAVVLTPVLSSQAQTPPEARHRRVASGLQLPEGAEVLKRSPSAGMRGEGDRLSSCCRRSPRP